MFKKAGVSYRGRFLFHLESAESHVKQKGISAHAEFGQVLLDTFDQCA